jgi:GDP-mannose 6-dehydrogenase
MNITVLGLGYVGCISAACLAQQGHQVIGVDVNPIKVDLINQGKSPIVERQVDEIISETVDANRLSATTDINMALTQSDVSLICVGTPSKENGSLDLKHIQNVCRELGRALRQQSHYQVVAVRSTILPGTLESVVLPLIEEESGKQVGSDFGLCVNPEFLREGSAVDDYYHPPYTLIGSWDQKTGEVMEKLYQSIDAPVFHTEIRSAELVKYVSNSFHALKVTFANEIGVLCKTLGIDSHKVMDIFTADTQLNISAKYLQPGFAFGGSCLPKDVRALVHRAKSLDLDLPILNAILPSNRRHIEHAFRLIQQSQRKKIGILGLSFKSGTDDLRESPMVRLVERLLGKGYDLRIYDRHVSMAKMIGANKQYIEQVIPHISTLLVPHRDQILAHAEILVVGNNTPEFRDIVSQVGNGQYVIDLARVETDMLRLNSNYQGICW